MSLFSATVGQMAFLMLLIAVGFFLAGKKVLPENASVTLSRLENNVFIPALVLRTFTENFTPERLQAAKTVFLFSAALAVVMIPISILLARLCAKDPFVRKIFTYGLAFSNFGFMGNAVVSALFPNYFFEYLIYTLPLWILIYLWGVPALLIPAQSGKKTLGAALKPLVNPMFVSMLVGILLGAAGVTLPGWLSGAVSSCAECMSPVAMLLTGITVAATDLKKIFADGRIYAVSAVRLILLPLATIALFLIAKIPQSIVICAVCASAMPLGLNTIVIPSAYGRDTSVAAGMAVISHLLSCVTIPLMLMLMQALLL